MTDTIILAGNPNVGKSTLFNRLTGLRQHTGNWAGKTVGSAVGYSDIGGRMKTIVDTPGTYSLSADSEDEINAANTVCTLECDCIVIVCDACCLERSLFLVLQIAEKRSGILVCVNLMDEAEKKGIKIDTEKLSDELSLPVVAVSASKGRGLNELKETMAGCENSEIYESASLPKSEALKEKAHIIYEKCVSESVPSPLPFPDRILSHRILAWPAMLLMLLLILWLSISGANLPSRLLSEAFASIGNGLKEVLKLIYIPDVLVSLLIDGVYGTTAWVVSVMLPPMAIFFPLFTLLEDFGLLPRIALNMDKPLKSCGGCGRQALCMCMGLGCNAVGVTGCRIISEKNERIIAALTNSLIPCNGRFPTIILMAGLLYPKGGSICSALTVLAVIALGIIITLISSKLLSVSLFKGDGSLFTLELPPYRKPKIAETLLRSLVDRTAIVLLRAIRAAAPAGLLIWLLGNIEIDGQSIMLTLSSALNGTARLFGMDGAILLGFILGFPANEIVMPAIIMNYISGSSLSAIPIGNELASLLYAAGWTQETVLCILLFTLLHWPCATTIQTVKAETGKLRYALLAAAIPTVWGLMLCFLIRIVA